MSEDEDQNIDESKRVYELFVEIQEAIEGEQILDVLYAIEKVVCSIVTSNCINKEAADEVVDTMHRNMKDIIEQMDNMKFAVWHSKETLN